MKTDEQYQGWTNSRTWNANWRLEQDERSYKEIVAVRKERTVTAAFVEGVFYHYFSILTFETWVKGKVNWQEIADNYNDQEY